MSFAKFLKTYVVYKQYRFVYQVYVHDSHNIRKTMYATNYKQ